MVTESDKKIYKLFSNSELQVSNIAKNNSEVKL